MNTGPHMLIILDGFGYSPAHTHNAVYSGQPYHFNTWLTLFPSSLLHASGHFVGLTPGMIGNSEVGHLTIGSGRVIKQPIALLHEAIKNGTFFKNPLLLQRLNELQASGKTLHILGLLSDGGVHSHSEHMFAFIKMAVQQGVKNILVHPFLDGRDTPPQSAAVYLQQLETLLKELGTGSIGSMHGRFYAMDRDHYWDRIEKTYKVLTEPQIPLFTDWKTALTASYEQGITDEFFVPISLHSEAIIQSDDAIIFCNFRADRARELTQALLNTTFTFFPSKPLEVSWMITATVYRPDFPVDVLLSEPVINDTLFDRLELAHKHLFTVAETEKYAHVTYFFNGGRELVRQQETRVLIPSKRHYKTYISVPCMSAPEITETVITSLLSAPRDFYLINYANADMVGHSGDFEATCKAVTCIDEELKKIYDVVVEQLNGTLYITADHGKAEDMFDESAQQPRTAHTKNKVPFLYINKNLLNKVYELPLIELSDIAPFILQDLNLEVPQVMKR